MSRESFEQEQIRAKTFIQRENTIMWASGFRASTLFHISSYLIPFSKALVTCFLNRIVILHSLDNLSIQSTQTSLKNAMFNLSNTDNLYRYQIMTVNLS